MDLQDQFDGFTARDWQTIEEGGPVRFAVIGLGWWTRDEAIPAIQQADLCETTVAVSSTTAKAESVAESVETIDHALTYEEFHDGAAREAYDAVYVATPNSKHLEYVDTAAGFGKDVLCEKPMEATLERAEAVVEACRDRDVTLMVAYRMQTEPAVRWARDLVQTGFIGEPVHVHSHLSQRLLEMIPNPDQWRLDPDLTGYGTSVMDLGPYPVNTTRFILDEDPIRVTAQAGSTGEAFDDVPDETAAFVLTYPNNCFAACTVSQNAAQSSRLSIVGLEGELTIEPAFFPHHPREVTVARSGTTASYEVEMVDQMLEEFEYFADCVLSGRSPVPDGAHGVTDMRIIKAIYDSAESNEPIQL